MKQRKKSFGMKISAFVLSFAMVCTLLAGVNVVAFAADDLDDSVNVMRFNNTMTGEHIFTANDGEINYYNGMQPVWQNEDVAWKAPLYSESGVYRIFNNLTFEHMWTTDAFEVFINTTYGPWTLEQDPAFYSADSTGVPVYRLSKKGYEGYGAHHYTVNETERFWLLASGEWNDEGVAFYGVKEEEPTEFSIVAVQSGENTITVTSDMALTALDDVDVIRGGKEQEISVDLSDDGKVVTITTVNNIVADEYVVVVTPADETIDPAADTFDGEVAKLSTIAFVSDEFILADPPAALAGRTAGFTAIRGFNQFGEMEILDDYVTAYVSGADTAIDGNPSYNPDNGVISAVATAAVPYIVGNPVSATAVYNDGTTVLQASANLTVSAKQVVNSLTFGDVDTLNPELEGERITHAGLQTNSYYIPVLAVDQYGLPIDADTLNDWQGNGSLIVTPWQLGNVFANVQSFDTLDDGTTVMMLGDGGSPYIGTQTFSIVSVGGTQATTSIEIEDARWISDLTVVTPDLTAGQWSPIGIFAVDQYGETFTEKDLYEMNPTIANSGSTIVLGDRNAMTNSQSKIEAAGGEFKIVKNDSKKSYTILYKAPNAKMDLMTISTARPTVTTKNLTINAVPTPAAVKGLSAKVNTVLGGDNFFVNLGNPTNIVFTDSTGAVMSTNADNYPQFVTGAAIIATKANGFYYTVEAKTSNYTNLADGVVTSKGQSTIGSDSFVITLYQKDSTATQTVKKLKDYTAKITASNGVYKSYTAEFVTPGSELAKATMYTGPDELGNGADTALLKVYGKDSAGNLVDITYSGMTDGLYDAELVNDQVAGAELGFDSMGMIGLPPVFLVVNTPSAINVAQQGTATVNIFDANDVVVATASIDCSNAAPVTAGVICMKNDELYDLDLGIVVTGMNQSDVEWETVAPGIEVVRICDNYTLDVYEIYTVDQYGRSNFDKVVYGGDPINLNAAPTTLASAGTLTVAGGSVSELVDVSLLTQ